LDGVEPISTPEIGLTRLMDFILLMKGLMQAKCRLLLIVLQKIFSGSLIVAGDILRDMMFKRLGFAIGRTKK
jgi:hypothetical protein